MRYRSPRELLREHRFQFAFHLVTDDLSIYFLKQRRYLKAFYGKHFSRLVRENHALNPTIVDPIYLTSEARMYHLSHLGFFEDKTNTNLGSLDTVIEYGAGYGGTTELLVRKLPRHATICVIDFPAMLRLQFHYLTECGLADRLAIPERDGVEPLLGKINLIPLSFKKTLHILTPMNPNLLIATWSLSEASKKSQESVIQSDFFGAQRIIYGYYAQTNPLLPETNSMVFPGYETEYHGPCFFSSDGMEKYHFLRRLGVDRVL